MPKKGVERPFFGSLLAPQGLQVYTFQMKSIYLEDQMVKIGHF